MSSSIPKIPPAEWEILEVLWEHPSLTGAEVHGHLPDTGRALKTVNTLLARLVERGVLAVTREGKAFRYTPRLEREDCVRAESRGFVERVFAGRWSPFVLQLVEEADLSDADLAELEALLEAKRKEVRS